MNNNEKECSICEGQGSLTDENYETGDCITCEGTGITYENRGENKCY